jgi:hypothetical protein
MYHPLAVIVLLSAAASALQTVYLVWFVHQFHSGHWWRYVVKMLPLFAVEAWFLTLAVRIAIWG